jgi:hypothetical protein
MKNPRVILFACPMWSSKFAIADYLSWNLGLPIFSRDAIRNEVKEDIGNWDREEFDKRAEPRLKELIKSKKDFILDASVDRQWENYKEMLEGYDIFIISIDISQEHLEKMIEAKEYVQGVGDRLDKNYQEHIEFLEKYSDKINVHITDENFHNRLDIVLEATKEWYNN